MTRAFGALRLLWTFYERRWAFAVSRRVGRGRAEPMDGDDVRLQLSHRASTLPQAALAKTGPPSLPAPALLLIRSSSSPLASIILLIHGWFRQEPAPILYPPYAVSSLAAEYCRQGKRSHDVSNLLKDRAASQPVRFTSFDASLRYNLLHYTALLLLLDVSASSRI